MSNDPLARLPAVATFTVTSSDVADGEPWAPAQMSGRLGVDDIGVPADSTPAYLGFNISSHVLGRAVLVATAER